jgi:hypothetical protein
MMRTFRLPLQPMKYPASNTTLSRGTAVSGRTVVGQIVVARHQENTPDGSDRRLLNVIQVCVRE